MQLRLKLTDSCLYFLYTDVKWCVLLYIITLYCTNVFLEVKIVVFFIYPLLYVLSIDGFCVVLHKWCTTLLPSL
jgi:hypothetical protein